MSELLSIALFLASVALYARKAGRNTVVCRHAHGVRPVRGAEYHPLRQRLLYRRRHQRRGTLHSDQQPDRRRDRQIHSAGRRRGRRAGCRFGALGWVLRRRRHHPHHVGYSLAALLLALASVDASPAFHQISELVKSQSREGDPDFAAYYKEPSKRIDNPQLNLVYIYGESLERTYFDNDAFPNLTPELGRIKDEGIDFSNTMQLPGTDYTIAGMVASQCGIPLFAPFEGNASASVSSFFPQNICLGDILKNSGYENYFVQGANLRFAGKDVFLKSHGFDHLFGAEELKTTVADPPTATTGASMTTRYLRRRGKIRRAVAVRKTLFAVRPDGGHPPSRRLYFAHLRA